MNKYTVRVKLQFNATPGSASAETIIRNLINDINDAFLPMEIYPVPQLVPDEFELLEVKPIDQAAN